MRHVTLEGELERMHLAEIEALRREIERLKEIIRVLNEQIKAGK